MNQCHRCQGKLLSDNNEYQNYRCLDCGFVSWRDGTFSIWHLIKKNDRLYWYLNQHQDCFFVDGNHKEVYLPILPFNISIERLKALLVFS